MLLESGWRKMYLNRTCFLKMLEYVREPVERGIRKILSDKEALEREKFPSSPLKLIVEAIVTRSWWRYWPWDKLVEALRKRGYSKWDGDSPKIGIEDLAFISDTLDYLYNTSGTSLWKEATDSIRFLEVKLKEIGSLKAWISKIYEVVKEQRPDWREHEYIKGIKGLGAKGVHDILRSFGYFDMAPIDIHERRFLLRTGILLRYGPSSGDPQDLEFYLEALRKFCKEELRGIKILGQDLGDAPGIVDMIIWHFCCTGWKGCKGICSADPRCEICPIKDCCLYYRLRGSK